MKSEGHSVGEKPNTDNSPMGKQVDVDQANLLLLNEIIQQAKIFSDEKYIDYGKISENSIILRDPYQSKEYFESYKRRLIQSTPHSQVELDCK